MKIINSNPPKNIVSMFEFDPFPKDFKVVYDATCVRCDTPLYIYLPLPKSTEFKSKCPACNANIGVSITY